MQDIIDLNEAVKDINHALNNNSKLLRNYVSLRKQFLRGFIYGIGLFAGTTFGVAIILGLAGWFLGQLKLVPIAGQFAIDVMNFIEAATGNSMPVN